MLFVVDFDGTIAPIDTVDALLQRFADPDWQRIEEQWLNGTINSQQCMAGQLALVRGERGTLLEFLEGVQIDPAFPDFVQYVRSFGEVIVVSDGLEYPIRHALEKARLDVPVFANTLHVRDHGLAISFPYADATCTVKSGVCKCRISGQVAGAREMTVVLIGDGKSDQCIARIADYVFAKSKLRDICAAEGIRHIPFDTFADVLDVVREWTDGLHREEERTCPLEASPT